MNKIKTFIISHKILSIAILIILISLGIYLFIRSKNTESTSYTTEKVVKGDITTYVTGTGQIAASDTITLKPKTEGDVTYVAVKAGDYVKKGALILSVDSRDAKIALESAKLNLKDLTTVNSLDLLKNENSLSESYDNGWNKLSSYITDTTSLLDNLSNIYSSDGYLGYKNINGLSSTGRAKVSQAENDYYKAKASFDAIVKIYKDTSRTDPNDNIKSLIQKAYDSSIVVANAVKSAETAFNYVVIAQDSSESDSDVSSNRSDISSWLGTSNGYVNSLLSVFNTIRETEESLSELKAGADEIDIESAKLNVQTKQEAYNDCFLRAPFDGIIATFTAKVEEASGSSVGTIITNQKVATISLNEVDIASVQLGQKATLTFDALSDLSISGTVVEIDSVGTVSSGVVTYNVKISLDKDDDRVKPGMSSNVEIVTNSKQNILTVSSSAIKTKNNVSYIEIVDSKTGKTIKKNIEIGISDDTLTEIVSGLNEGDVIVSKITTSGTSKSNSSSNSKNSSRDFGGPMMGGAVGGAMMR